MPGDILQHCGKKNIKRVGSAGEESDYTRTEDEKQETNRQAVKVFFFFFLRFFSTKKAQ